MCDTLCSVGPSRTLFGKNSDRPRDEVQVVEAHPARHGNGSLRTTHLDLDDTGAYALVGSRPTWMWGFEHGCNEHRVAIGNERIFTIDDPRAAPPALTGMDLVRLGLERARTADEAVDVMTALLERHGQGGRCAEHEDDPYWSSFLVADPEGAWILETSDRTWAARAVDDGAAISNRVTLGTDWTLASTDVERGRGLRHVARPAVSQRCRPMIDSPRHPAASRNGALPSPRLTWPRPSDTTATGPGERPGPIRATGRHLRRASMPSCTASRCASTSASRGSSSRRPRRR